MRRRTRLMSPNTLTNALFAFFEAIAVLMQQIAGWLEPTSLICKHMLVSWEAD
jgi:hypothetical protein